MHKVFYDLLNSFKYWDWLHIWHCCTINLNSVLFLIKSFFYAWPSSSFLFSYVIIVGLWYLHIRACYTRLDVLAFCLSLFCTISDHLVVGSILVKGFSIRGISCPYIIILYASIISINYLFQSMTPTSFAVKWPCFYFNFFLLTSFANLNVGPNFFPYIRPILMLPVFSVLLKNCWDNIFSLL